MSRTLLAACAGIAAAIAFCIVAALALSHCAPAEGAATPTAVFGMREALQACVDPEAGVGVEEACVDRVNARYCGPEGLFRDSGQCPESATPRALLDAGRNEAGK